MFGYVNGAMQYILTFFYHLTSKLGFPNYGAAIILLTVAIKALFFPLSLKQIESMRKMRELGPQLKALRAKYKNDLHKQQQEITLLYKKSGVNPLSGCLPLLIQMPFLTGIFYTIKNFSYASQPSFLWIKNLAGTDPFYILPFLAALTTYISSQQSMTDSSQNRAMLIIVPFIIGFMTLRFPAGLGLYWVVSNLIQIMQQWFLYRKPVSGQRAPI
ncbi:putative membrane protein [Propionispora sp. 2/2-37]|uniref:YidC/Oxa1 family membrane protein insertase n=1 Tax=Propionispora sp. 2/2-37 TaxID=1677858 RepID=UPI0006C353CB|nr:YidC/Oxa1 family membrane protein insertase [Propionispora sp. 2/2-37]CUH95552.1 putative membrane protein [Propionispora sp. 2/2-37]